MKKFFSAILACAAVSLSAADLVRDSLPDMVPSIGENATAPERFAADEVRRLLRKLTNADYPGSTSSRIVIGTPETHPEIAQKAQWLGLTQPDMKQDDAFVLRSDGDTVYAAANTPEGAMFAVFEMFEQCGFRWFFPSEAGEFLPPKTPRLQWILPDAGLRSAPAFRFRALGAHYQFDKYMFLNHCKLTTSSPLPKKYGRKGYRTTWGGHSFNWIFPENCDSIQQYFTKYPEQFSWDARKKSRRIGQHCFSNPETKKTFLKWIDRFWTEHPDVFALTLVPRDSPDFCECPECAKSDPSLLTHKFIGDLIRESEKTHPGKFYHTIAYSFYTNAPDCDLPPNQYFTLCMTKFCYAHAFSDPNCPRNPLHREMLRAWKAKLPVIGSYGYDFIAFGGDAVLTPFTPNEKEYLQYCRDAGLAGIVSENFDHFDVSKPWEDQVPFANRYEIYAYTKLLWNPDLDTDMLLADFCRVSFGSAKDDMLEYRKLMENAWRKSESCLSGYGGNYRKFVSSFLSPEMIEKAEALFASALEKTRNEPEARKLITADRAVFSRWKRARRNYDEALLVANGTIDRSEELKNCPAGKILYKLDPEKIDRKTKRNPDLVDSCFLCRDPDPDAMDFEEVVPYFTVAPNPDSDFLFGNHPRIFPSASEWFNYEVSFQFRFPPRRFFRQVDFHAPPVRRTAFRRAEQRQKRVLPFRIQSEGGAFLSCRVSFRRAETRGEEMEHRGKTGKRPLVFPADTALRPQNPCISGRKTDSGGDGVFLLRIYQRPARTF